MHVFFYLGASQGFLGWLWDAAGVVGGSLLDRVGIHLGWFEHDVWIASGSFLNSLFIVFGSLLHCVWLAVCH